ncbi:MAG TPA: type II toxin-antitoxin system VapC family toxin [Terriglobales bacterium]|nr:type II toxin-antitoxin system VapC family toxin [Terriglobales bacterium]
MILLDTHVLVWLQQEPRKLSRRAAALIRRAQTSSEVAVSAITIVELATLLNRGRLRTRDTLQATIRRFLEDVAVLPLTEAIAIEAGNLQKDMLPDPMDRMIAATAQLHGVPLVTADERMINCAWISTVW